MLFIQRMFLQSICYPTFIIYISSPTCFGTQMLCSGSQYNKGVYANLLSYYDSRRLASRCRNIRVGGVCPKWCITESIRWLIY